MKPIEKDRLIEILFYLYFNNKDSRITGKAEFWDMIKSICVLYKINNISVAQALRLLTNKENRPEEAETVYLFNKIGTSVRHLNKISGIYWQKKIAIEADITAGNIPEIRNRITDVIIKRAMRDFVYAVYDINGILKYISETQFDSIV
jgi:hypothetical protein